MPIHMTMWDHYGFIPPISDRNDNIHPTKEGIDLAFKLMNKAYKKLMTKYKHKKLGYIATKGIHCYSFLDSAEYRHDLPLAMVEDSQDWEKVEENPWFIKSLKKEGHNNFYKAGDGKFTSLITTFNRGTYTYEQLSPEGWQIATVSNGKEEFSVGDTVSYQSHSGKLNGSINEFLLNGNAQCIEAYIGEKDINWAILHLEKEEDLGKAPILYTTEDSVKRYEYQAEWWIINQNKWVFYDVPNLETCGTHFQKGYGSLALSPCKYKIFSTKEAAEKFIASSNPKKYWVSRIINPNSEFSYFSYSGISPSTSTIYGYETQNLSFSSEQEAKDFIENNKKKYSIEDIKKAYHGTRDWSLNLRDSIIKNLKNGTN